MTHETTHASRTHETTQPGAWVLPAIGGGILALLWGAYTLAVVASIAAMPPP